MSADVAWSWASNERPLRLPEGDSRTAMWEYQLYSLPPGRRAPHSDVATANEELRRLGLPVDKWLREQGMVEPPDGD